MRPLSIGRKKKKDPAEKVKKHERELAEAAERVEAEDVLAEVGVRRVQRHVPGLGVRARLARLGLRLGFHEDAEVARLDDVEACVKNKIFMIRSTWSMVNGSEKKRSVPDFRRSSKQRGSLGLKE